MNWLERNGLSLPAITLYLVFAAAILSGSVFLLTADRFEKVTTTQNISETGERLPDTEKREGQLPIASVIALLGFGGALVIPLKYVWDELGNSAANRRTVTINTRNRVHEYLEKHYVPIFYALTDVSAESFEWSELLKKKVTNKQVKESFDNAHDIIVFDRWVYSVAQVWQAHRNMRQQGGSWFFSTHAGEEDTAAGFRKVITMFDEHWGKQGTERSRLGSALLELKPRSLHAFRAHLHPTNSWSRRRRAQLVELRTTLRAVQDPAVYAAFGRAAALSSALIRFHATEVYAPWYSDPWPPADKEGFDAATAWAKE